MESKHHEAFPVFIVQTDVGQRRSWSDPEPQQLPKHRDKQLIGHEAPPPPPACSPTRTLCGSGVRRFDRGPVSLLGPSAEQTWSPWSDRTESALTRPAASPSGLGAENKWCGNFSRRRSGEEEGGGGWRKVDEWRRVSRWCFPVRLPAR